MKNTHTKKAFTLLEILVVITLILILVGAGVPTLFEATRIFRFKKDAQVVQTFFNNARSAAINNRALEDAASFGVDTNFDGIPPTPNSANDPGDTVPFVYVFEISRNTANDVVLRLYADYSNDQEFGANDIVIEEETIAGGAYGWDFEGNEYPLDGSDPIERIDPAFSYSFAFAPPFGELTMWDEEDPTPRYYGFLQLFMMSERLNREALFFTMQNSGIVVYFEEIIEEAP